MFKPSARVLSAKSVFNIFAQPSSAFHFLGSLLHFSGQLRYFFVGSFFHFRATRQPLPSLRAASARSKHLTQIQVALIFGQPFVFGAGLFFLFRAASVLQASHIGLSLLSAHGLLPVRVWASCQPSGSIPVRLWHAGNPRATNICPNKTAGRREKRAVERKVRAVQYFRAVCYLSDSLILFVQEREKIQFSEEALIWEKFNVPPSFRDAGARERGNAHWGRVETTPKFQRNSGGRPSFNKK